MHKIKVITSYKLADAFVCHKLEKQFPGMEIIRYKIQAKAQQNWYFHKLRKEGIWRAIGIKLMGVYLGLGNIYNRLRNKTVWQKENLPLPEWNSIKAKIHNCHSEKELFELVRDGDCIIALDTLRLPQKFFHKIKAPFLQVVYGHAPDYVGHTGVFWAYAGQDYEKVGISIIQRGRYFTKSGILLSASVAYSANETLRSLRTKSAITAAENLPVVLRKILNGNIFISEINTPQKMNYCTTPTLYFYLKFRATQWLRLWPVLQPKNML